MTVKTRYALSLTAGSSATCMAALPHHLGEKAIPYSGIGFCERDSAIVESRTELITDSLNRTSHPFRRNVEPAAPQAQPLAGFAKDEVSWLRLPRARDPRHGGGALRARLVAPGTRARQWAHCAPVCRQPSQSDSPGCISTRTRWQPSHAFRSPSLSIRSIGRLLPPFGHWERTAFRAARRFPEMLDSCVLARSRRA